MKIYVITLKNSKRKLTIKRLKKLKLKFEIIYGVNGQKLSKKKLLKLIDPDKIKSNIGRNLSLPEVGTSASHLVAYNKIVDKKINQAIILEDDVYVSDTFSKWVKMGIKAKDNEIISFHASPSGLIYKRNKEKIIIGKEKINIHNSKTHLYSCAAYQINFRTCLKILKITNNNVIGIPDWPFFTKKHNIKIKITIPFMSLIVDKGTSLLARERNKEMKKRINFHKFIPKKIFYFLKSLIFISFIPYLFLGKYKCKNYKEIFFYKEFFKVVNFFSRNYYDLNKIFFIKKYYNKNLHKQFSKNKKINYTHYYS
jgi:GR25 family glycosyltransferase involved in LPS biosynthesis